MPKVAKSWFACLLWLMGLTGVFADLSPVTFNYDAGNRVMIAYDSIQSAVVAYDSGVVRYFSGREGRTEGTGDPFVEFAKFLAAETTAADSSLLAKYLNTSGGRWGGTGTRLLNDSLATSLEDAGHTVTGGAGRAAEEWIPGVGGGTKGGTFVDLRARLKNRELKKICRKP